MSLNTARSIAGRLSLREPQWESLQKLVSAIEAVPALRDHEARSAEDLTAMIGALKGQFANLSDFERDFPSFCFALATGVGKTRLMGAFISYLHAAFGYKHFFVLAPNLTIYNKLIADFTPNTPKYVFKGIAEFAVNPPKVITGDNYEQQNMSGGELLGDVHINIFNISKINSEVRGGKSPRIKRLSEYLGQSYFEYLASLPDLILLMDESHRYRASAGVKALNELKPLMGLELTATPFVEGASKPIPFKNVVMDYPLARAIEDGFVKDPAVVTQQNFNKDDHSPEQIERIKLMDAVRVHEETKVHLLTYAQQTGQKLVKPFMLVIARDTSHASQLMQLIQSSEFFNGYYANKVIQVDSGTTSGAEGDAVIEKLLAVESYDEPTEIVIHVNMLKEGWDVTNLYTIVPLRAANARTLIEQSIGRGLRLPYGRRTGDETVDRLNIIAHDRFQEVVDEAGKGDSPIRMKVLELTPAQPANEKPQTVLVTSAVENLLGITQQKQSQFASTSGIYQPIQPTAPVLTAEQTPIAQATLNVIEQISRQQSFAPTSATLNQAHVQAEIIKQVEAIVSPKQIELIATGPSVADIVKTTVAIVTKHTIDIPRILVKPKGNVKSGFHPFTLDVSKINFQPASQQLVSKALQSGKEITMGKASLVYEARLEDYLVRELINYDDISYDHHAALIHELAGQAVGHFKSYLTTEDEIHNVLGYYGKQISENIHSQMLAHYYEDVAEVEVVVSQGFTPLKPSAITAVGEILTLEQLPTEKSKIAQTVYGGFNKCAYTYQKFHSDTERVFAAILERDAQVWFRPVSGQFNIFYRNGIYESEYIPDFVASTGEYNLIIETKKLMDIENEDVKAKAAAATSWCENATNYSVANGGKPWRYFLIPHDKVSIAMTLTHLTII